MAEKPDGSDWKVALTDPRDPEGDYLGAITLNDGEFLSTSGDYEKYFIEDGKRYHHILDPKDRISGVERPGLCHGHL